MKILKELRAVLEGWYSEDPVFDKEVDKEAGKPELSEVLYVGDGPKKRCRSCVMWVKTEKNCAIHPRSISVGEDSVCGYWVGGDPMREWPEKPGLQAVDPRYSGLTIGPKGGCDCSGCRYFEAQTDKAGRCHAVLDGDHPAIVHPRGCCTRWSN